MKKNLIQQDLNINLCFLHLPRWLDAKNNSWVFIISTLKEWRAGESPMSNARVALSQLLRIYKDILGHIVLRFAAGAY